MKDWVELTPSPGCYTAEIKNDGYETIYREIIVDEKPRDYYVVLKENSITIPVNGYVYQQDYDDDESNDIPLVGATVTLTENTTDTPKEYTVTTDNKGYYDFSEFFKELAGSYNITINAKGLEDYYEEKISIRSSNLDKPQKIYMEKSYSRTFGTVTIGKGSNVNDYKNAHVKKVIIESDGAVVGERPFELSLIDEIEIKDGVTIIPKELFYNTIIKKITIPESVTHVYSYAFCLAKLPKDFEMGKGIIYYGVSCFSNAYLGSARLTINTDTMIESDAFASCKIKEVRIVSARNGYISDCGLYHATIEKVSISDTATLIPANLFVRTTIQEIDIPDNITDVGNWAFYYASLPENFQMGKGIKNIDESSFCGVDLSNTKIYITNDMEIGTQAFAHCKIKEVDLSLEKNASLSMIFDESTIDKVTISETTTVIPKNIFIRTTIHEIKIPSSVKRIEDSAFWAAKLPSDFSVPEGVELGKQVFRYDE